jgi:phospholipase/carboxylesterase
VEARTDLPLHCLESPAPADGRGNVVFLHGLGSNAEDMAVLVDDLQFPARYLAFHGTFRVPTGEHYQGRSWYQRAGRELVGLDESVTKLRQSLNALKVDAEKTVVVGFSQGAAVGLSVVLESETAPAGLCLLSGFVAEPSFLDHRRERIQKLYCLLCHGIHDEVVPFADGLHALDMLASHGARARLVAFPSSHWISVEAVVELRRFLEERLPPPPSPPAG